MGDASLAADASPPGSLAPHCHSFQVRRPLVLLVLLILNVMTLMLIAGHGPWAGRTILVLGDDHGLNAGDIPVLLMWLIGSASCIKVLIDDAPT